MSNPKGASCRPGRKTYVDSVNQGHGKKKTEIDEVGRQVQT